MKESNHFEQHVISVLFLFLIRNGVICVVRVLLSACPESVNDIDYGSCTPLHYAVKKGRVEVATLLLQNGAAVDYR